MTNNEVVQFIEEELGQEVYPWQRAILDLWFPPPPPYVPPKQTWQVKARRWFNRVILRRRPMSLSGFDAALRSIYAPAMREHINQHNTLFTKIRDEGIANGRSAVWKVKP
jgi:hypothetical protein